MIFDRDFQRAADSGTEGLAGLDGPAAHSADNAAADRLVKRSLDKFPAVNEPAADDDARYADAHNYICDADAEIVADLFKRSVRAVVAVLGLADDLDKSRNALAAAGGRSPKYSDAAEAADAYFSQQPRLPQTHGLPPATIVIWPNSPAMPLPLPVPRKTSLPMTSPTPMPVPERTRMKFVISPSSEFRIFRLASNIAAAVESFSTMTRTSSFTFNALAIGTSRQFRFGAKPAFADVCRSCRAR